MTANFILVLNLIVKFVLKFAIFEKTTYLCIGSKEMKQQNASYENNED